MEMIRQTAEGLLGLLSYSNSGYETVDSFVWTSSWLLDIAAIAGVTAFILLNPELREHKRTDDRLLFFECVLVICMNLLDVLLIPLTGSSQAWTGYAFVVSLTVIELLCLMIILQWLVFVDYSLYRSIDHIRRRYTHAVIPVVVLFILDLIQNVVLFGQKDAPEIMHVLARMIYFGERTVEMCYIVMAILLVKKHSRERREPRFIRLEAFIIPFVLGMLFRFYDGALISLGIILTYGAVVRRDRFLNSDTGFYNRDFLDHYGAYRDKR